MDTRVQRTSAEWLAFGGYTLLGYLSLGLHHWIFAPGIAGAGSAAQVFLVMANLLAGTWCFLRALRAAWTSSHG
ncbi:MAG TPA: hypothetical protein VGA56_11550 [Opitutaceae bacterium]